MKIGTLKICPEWSGQRIGEGALGLALLDWQKSSMDQIYVTVFPKHESLVSMLGRYGFTKAGIKQDGEIVFLKDKTHIDYYGNGDAGLSSFPYIDPDFKYGRYIPIEPEFHDIMFGESLMSAFGSQSIPAPVSNGFIKSYIATPYDHIDYRPGDVVFIYRKSKINPTMNSRLTEFCTISKVDWIKNNGKVYYSREEFGTIVGNKTVYSDNILDQKYSQERVCVITLVCNGSFPKDSKLIHKWLKENDLFWDYPYKIRLSHEQVLQIFREGEVDEGNVIGCKSRACEKHVQR